MDEVARNKEEFDSLLASCDLLETPFDQSQFEADISALQGKLEQCGEVGRDVARALKRGGPPFFLGQILFDVVIRMC